jgi:hypothetical protein
MALITRRSPSLTLLARCEVLKQHVVGERESEVGADFSSLVLPIGAVPLILTTARVPWCPYTRHPCQACSA